MKKIAFVFPGQGSQYVGMGRDFYDKLDSVKKLYDEASEVLGYDVADLSFNGPLEELNKTYRAQPCILIASIAAYTALAEKKIKPTFVAGHSLGEYSALVAARSISFRDAVRITEMRGRIMQEEVPEGKGMIAAILGIERNTIDEICSKISNFRKGYWGHVSVANYNCPGQIVISGEKPAVEWAIEEAKKAGAKKAVPLALSVPPHCKLMENAGKKFEGVLKKFKIKNTKIPAVTNSTAKIISKADDIRKALVIQLSNPVLWEDCVRKILSYNTNCFIELGPGKVLTGLIKRIEPSSIVFNVDNMEALDRTISGLMDYERANKEDVQVVKQFRKPVPSWYPKYSWE